MPPAKQEAPIALDLEQVGEAVIKLEEALRGARSKVRDKLLVLMLNDMTGIPKREIQRLLDAIPELARTYLKR